MDTTATTDCYSYYSSTTIALCSTTVGGPGFADVGGVRGFEVARVFLIFSFWHENKEYPSALIHWYSHVGSEPDEETGLWMVEPDTDDSGDPHLAIIHLDSIYRAVHLLPAHRNNTFVDHAITMHSSLDSFKLFYINKYADHQSFEVLW
jgi:hypothetical protein